MVTPVMLPIVVTTLTPYYPRFRLSVHTSLMVRQWSVPSACDPAAALPWDWATGCVSGMPSAPQWSAFDSRITPAGMSVTPVPHCLLQYPRDILHLVRGDLVALLRTCVHRTPRSGFPSIESFQITVSQCPA